MMSYQVKPVKSGDKVKLKTRKKVPYKDIISLLIQGEDVFIDVDRKMSYYIKKQLNEALKSISPDFEIEAYPSIYEDEDGEKEGYVYRLVRWKGGDKIWIEIDKLKGEIEKKLARAETELKGLEIQPPDKSLTQIKAMLKTRIETLREVLDIINNLKE